MYIYTVNTGDSPGSIERRFALEKGSITALNALSDPLKLTKGLALGIPDAVHAPAKRRELWLSCTRALPPSKLHGFCSEASFVIPPALDIKAAVLAEEDTYLPLAEEKAQSGSARFMLHLAAGDRRGAHETLRGEDSWNRLCPWLSGQLEKAQWGGIYLDLPMLPPCEHDRYRAFIRRVSDTVHEAGACLAIRAELGAENFAELGELSGFYDRLFLCPESPSGRFGGPLFHDGHLRVALEKALSHVPSEKCILLCPASGTDRAENGKSKALSMAAAADMACALGAEVGFDREAKAPFFEYKDPLALRHRVWFEDLRSLDSRCDLTEEYALAGICVEHCAHLSPPGLELLCQRLDPRQ